MYWERYYIMKFLGYSYHRKENGLTGKPLFLKKALDGYQFAYTEKDTLMAPYMAFRYHIRWESKDEIPR